MVTIEEARALLERRFAEQPAPVAGELYISPDWFEDETDYLPVWGSREFFVDGIEAFARRDNLVLFIDKRTGAFSEGLYTLNLDKVSKMTPVRVPD